MGNRAITEPLALTTDYVSIDGRYTDSNGNPYASVAAAEAALGRRMNQYTVGLTVLVKESGWTEGKEYWVQPYETNGVTAYHLVRKGGEDLTKALTLSGEQKYYASANVSDRPADVVIETGVVKALGYKVLNPTLSFAEQLSDNNVPLINTTFEIRNQFDLNGEIVEIPNNCILFFNGGRLKNGIIRYQNTYINGKADMDVSIASGSYFANNQVNLEWFGVAKYDVSKAEKNSDIINNVATVCKTLYLGYGRWYYSKPIILNGTIMFTCDGELSWSNSVATNIDTITLTGVSTNSKIYIQSITNAEGFSTLKNRGFYNNYGKDTSVRAFCIKNCHCANVEIKYISNFNEGIRIIGDGEDCTYNKVHDGQISYSNVGVRIMQKSRLYGSELVNCNIPVMYVWRCENLITIEAGKTLTITNSNTAVLINQNKNQIIELTNSSYTPAETTQLYIADKKYGTTVEYTNDNVQGAIITNKEGLVIPSANGNAYISSKLTPEGSRNILYNTEVSKRTLFKKIGDAYISIDDYNNSKPYTLQTDSDYYIVQSTSDEFYVAYISGRTAGCSNNNFVENIRHTTYTEEKVYNRISFLVKGTRWENPNQEIDPSNFWCDTYDKVNAIYLNNISCENNTNVPANIFRNLNESSINISRSEAVKKCFQLEGNCYDLELSVEYGNFTIDCSNIGSQAFVFKKGSTYPVIANYEKGEIEVRNNIFISKNNRFFFKDNGEITQGYTNTLDIANDGFPTFLKNITNKAVIGFKLRNISSLGYNNCVITSNNAFRIGIIYLTIVDEDIERDVEVNDVSKTFAPPTPYFAKWSSSTSFPKYQREEAGKTTYQFMIPYNIRDFYLFIFKDNLGATKEGSMDNFQIRGTNIFDITPPRRTEGTSEQRPYYPPIGFSYHDTTLNTDIIWNGKAWEPTKKSGLETPKYLTNDNAGFTFYLVNRNINVIWTGSKWERTDGTDFIEYGGTWHERPLNPVQGILFEDTACHYRDDSDVLHTATTTNPIIIKFNGHMWVKEEIVTDPQTQEDSIVEYTIFDNDDTEEVDNQPVWGTIEKRAELGIRARRSNDTDSVFGIQEYQYKMRKVVSGNTVTEIIRFDKYWMKSDGTWYVDVNASGAGHAGNRPTTNLFTGLQCYMAAESINNKMTICVSPSASSTLAKWGFVGDVYDASNQFIDSYGTDANKPYSADDGYLYWNTTHTYMLLKYNNYWYNTYCARFFDNIANGKATTLSYRLSILPYKGYDFSLTDNGTTKNCRYDGFKWISIANQSNIIDAQGTYDELNNTENLSSFYNYQCYCTDLDKDIIWKHGVWYYMDEFDADGNPIPVIIEEESEE